MLNADYIEVCSVSQAFSGTGLASRVVALTETSITVRRGELLCLIGPSGCGKSSLLNIIGGLATPSAGEVRIDGQRVTGPLPQKVAFVFQESTLFPWQTVLQNVMTGLEFQGVARSEREHRATDALTAVGLLEFRNHFPRQLSGGMKQRVQLARALSLQTDIILMDEPFAALDEQTRMVLGEDLSTLLAKANKTIIFVTHSLGEAVFLADRVATFSARPGRITKIIDINEAHPRRRDFMTSEKLASLRNQLYDLLHEEVRKTMEQTSSSLRRSA
jgi:NitT/TauT family transport system ATP-binding protein